MVWGSEIKHHFSSFFYLKTNQIYHVCGLFNLLKEKSCSVFSAPLDVRLAEKNKAEEETINVVQPDIMVVCDTSKIDDRGIQGAPDWIIEITSPSTIKHDFGTKLLLYQKYRVWNTGLLIRI